MSSKTLCSINWICIESAGSFFCCSKGDWNKHAVSYPRTHAWVCHPCAIQWDVRCDHNFLFLITVSEYKVGS